MKPDKNMLAKFASGENNMIQFSDSSDDEDYVYESNASENSNISSSGGSSSTENDDDDDVDDDDVDDDDDDDDNHDEHEESDQDEENDSQHNQGKQDEGENNKHHKQAIEQNDKHSAKNSETKAPKDNNHINCSQNDIKIEKKKIKEHCICCVCLNEESETYDELVSCDSCGFYTHEGCYGINDAESKQTSVSSSSTEPWFCNSCLVDDKHEPKYQTTNTSHTMHNNLSRIFKRNCQLCPNTECGLLKETENGKFVHILCALYTPGIAYQDTDKLWPVVLDEIGSSKWGEQICSLCENIHDSRTGICIKCDAGLCKTYFHVTCAQKYGYLVDPHHQQNSGDPFIAYCKMHNDKSTISSRKTSYLAMMSSYRCKHRNDQRLFELESEKDRFCTKFTHARDNYELAKQKILRHSSESVKKARMLTTCPSALKKLSLKSTLNNDLGSSGDVLIDQQNQCSSTITFSVNFIKYYFEREKKILQYFKELNILKQSQEVLTLEEHELRAKEDQKSNERTVLVNKNNELREKLKAYINVAELLSVKGKCPHDLFQKMVSNRMPNAENHSTASTTLIKSTPKKQHKNDTLPKSTQNGSSPPANIKKEKNISPPCLLDRSISNSKTHFNANSIKKEAFINNLNINASCCMCGQKTMSHLLVDCDTCKEYYHISCLDPPLTAVPKKTKLYGWECSKCVRKKDNSSDEEMANENTEKAKRERKPRILSSSCIDYDFRFKARKQKQKTPVKGKQRRRRKGKQQQNQKANQTVCVMSTYQQADENMDELSEQKTESSSCKQFLSESEAIYIDDDESSAFASPKGKAINATNLILNRTMSAKNTSSSVLNTTHSDVSTLGEHSETKTASRKSQSQSQSQSPSTSHSLKRSRSLSSNKNDSHIDKIITSVIAANSSNSSKTSIKSNLNKTLPCSSAKNKSKKLKC